jgi:uncharacterized protein with HEPN domain
MSRDPGLYLQDIDAGCEKIRLLVEGMDFDTFTDDWRTRDAVLHNLKVIGDAVRRLPESFKARQPQIPWSRIVGFRDVLAHAYFTLDDTIVWDMIQNELPPLHQVARQLLSELDGPA